MVEDSANSRAEVSLGVLRDALDGLHFAADKPNLRDIAKRTGESKRSISHTTVGAVLRCAKLPVWPTLKVVVEALGGDVEEFRRLWREAEAASQGVGVVNESHRGILEEEAVAVDYSLTRRLGYNDHVAEPAGLELRFKRIEHHHVRAVANSFKELYFRPTVRRMLFERAGLAYANSVVVHLALVTADGYLVLGHRSSRPRFYENTWSASFEEHMKPSEDGTDPFDSALRGLKEELIGRSKTAVAAEDVRFFSLFREIDLWENSEHLVGIPYNFASLWRVVNSDSFDPTGFDGLRVPPGVDPTFPNLATRPLWRRQHPTNQIRLIRCLTADFPEELRQRLSADHSDRPSGQGLS